MDTEPTGTPQTNEAGILVTFALLAYNQEQYIRESVEAALAQTYSPLELLISDDCSTDRTFEIIQEIASRYRGPHRVVTNRNPKNLGISTHLRKIHEMAQGEIIVHAAGDDVSLPHRTAVTVEAFARVPVPPTLVFSNAMKIDREGRELGLLLAGSSQPVLDRPPHPLQNRLGAINGCAAAVHRSVVEAFPAPIEGIIAEDVVLIRRANLLNGIQYIPDALVKYRCHDASISFASSSSRDAFIATNRRWIRDRLLRFEQLERDVAHVGYAGGAEFAAALASHKRRSLLAWEIIDRGLGGSSLALVRFLFESLRPGGSLQYFRNNLKIYLVRWAGRAVGYR